MSPLGDDQWCKQAPERRCENVLLNPHNQVEVGLVNTHEGFAWMKLSRDSLLPPKASS